MTQRDRVLRVLRTVGQRGVTQADFIRWPTPDGGPPITRLAARIEELRAAGYFIASGSWRDKCVVYSLIAEPDHLVPLAAASVSTDDAGVTVQGALFNTPAAAPRNALDDDWVA